MAGLKEPSIFYIHMAYNKLCFDASCFSFFVLIAFPRLSCLNANERVEKVGG